MVRFIHIFSISILMIFISSNECNAQYNDSIKNINTHFKDTDELIEKYTTLYLSNDLDQYEKCDFLLDVYHSYIQSEDIYFSTIAESIFIFRSRRSVVYNYNLFIQEMYKVYKDIESERMNKNMIIKLNRLASILSIPSKNSFELFLISQCKIIDPTLTLEIFLKEPSGFANEQKQLLEKGFSFSEFKQQIDDYVEIVDVYDDSLYEKKFELREKINEMHLQLLRIKAPR